MMSYTVQGYGDFPSLTTSTEKTHDINFVDVGERFTSAKKDKMVVIILQKQVAERTADEYLKINPCWQRVIGKKYLH